MTTVSPTTTEKEISHLMRRIGFGGSKEEIDQFLVENLLKNYIDHMKTIRRKNELLALKFEKWYTEKIFPSFKSHKRL